MVRMGTIEYLYPTVRYPRNNNIFNFGVFINNFLNITRVDIEAACNNDVLLAVDDIEITIFVYSGNIAGMQPAVAQSFGRLCGIIPVPLHHLRTSDVLFSSFAHRELPVTCLQIHNDTISVIMDLDRKSTRLNSSHVS